MAQQEGLIKLKGKIGDLSFFKTTTGYQARQCGGVSASRIKMDPAFVRTRENNQEFATVAHAAKKLRDTLRGILLHTNDPKMSNRLCSRFSRIIKADGTSRRGERSVQGENLVLLKDFNFNELAVLNDIFYAPKMFSIDAEAGTAQVTLPAFKPEVAVVKPKGASHFRLVAGFACINFEGAGSTLATVESEYLELRENVAEQTLDLRLTETSPFPMLLLFGINFFQEINGNLYPLNAGTSNALSLVSVHF